LQQKIPIKTTFKLQQEIQHTDLTFCKLHSHTKKFATKNHKQKLPNQINQFSTFNHKKLHGPIKPFSTFSHKTFLKIQKQTPDQILLFILTKKTAASNHLCFQNSVFPKIHFPFFSQRKKIN
jgi:hypothetical protein